MSHSQSSNRWLERQRKDPLVRSAQKNGYRSRAWFKLEQLHAKYPTLFPFPGAVIDLGAAPGGWSHYLSTHLPASFKLLASDRLSMKNLPRVSFTQGDFLSSETQLQIKSQLRLWPVSTILSDLAPNLTGNTIIDQANTFQLMECAFLFSRLFLSDQGSFVVKAFQGSELPRYQQSLQPFFQRIKIYKPPASRSDSRELYLVGLSFRRTDNSAVLSEEARRHGT